MKTHHKEILLLMMLLGSKPAGEAAAFITPLAYKSLRVGMSDIVSDIARSLALDLSIKNGQRTCELGCVIYDIVYCSILHFDTYGRCICSTYHLM